MSKRLTVLGVIGLVVLLVAIQHFQQPARPTIFADMSFDQAQAAAATGNKLLVVDFGAGWCPPCREMDRKTWTSGSLTSWLGEHAVTIKVDIDEDPGRGRAFGVTAVPTVVALSGTKEVGRWTGYTGASDLLERLKAAAPK
jgi:thioredoxin-like negative regulator of GroEL